jgi:hypothetical protein
VHFLQIGANFGNMITMANIATKHHRAYIQSMPFGMAPVTEGFALFLIHLLGRFWHLT